MNKSKPISGCIKTTCEQCIFQNKIICHHTLQDKLDFGAMVIPWFMVFFYGMITGGHTTALVHWLILAIFFFGYFEALVLCRHCPHYAAAGFLLSCHANSSLPKIPKYDPKPAKTWERIAWLAYVAILFLFYVPFFILAKQWFLLMLNLTLTITFAWLLMRTKCWCCCNFSCILNYTPRDVREEFFNIFPQVKQAWEQ